MVSLRTTGCTVQEGCFSSHQDNWHGVTGTVKWDDEWTPHEVCKPLTSMTATFLVLHQALSKKQSTDIVFNNGVLKRNQFIQWTAALASCACSSWLRYWQCMLCRRGLSLCDADTPSMVTDLLKKALAIALSTAAARSVLAQHERTTFRYIHAMIQSRSLFKDGGHRSINWVGIQTRWRHRHSLQSGCAVGRKCKVLCSHQSRQNSHGQQQFLWSSMGTLCSDPISQVTTQPLPDPAPFIIPVETMRQHWQWLMVDWLNVANSMSPCFKWSRHGWWWPPVPPVIAWIS